MQVLPMADTSKDVLFTAVANQGATKGKRKASEDLSAGGKKHVGLDVDVDVGNFEVIDGKYPNQSIPIINSNFLSLSSIGLKHRHCTCISFCCSLCFFFFFLYALQYENSRPVEKIK
jgi:hypothetical protein